MIGYQVVSKFDSMSYFITRSCLFDGEESDYESEESIDYRRQSDHSLQSTIKGIGGTEYLSSNQYISSESQTLIEDSTSF